MCRKSDVGTRRDATVKTDSAREEEEEPLHQWSRTIANALGFHGGRAPPYGGGGVSGGETPFMVGGPRNVTNKN